MILIKNRCGYHDFGRVTRDFLKVLDLLKVVVSFDKEIKVTHEKIKRALGEIGDLEKFD